MPKNPWIAAVLNLLLFGAGYIYNGRQVKLGWGITIACAVLRYAEVRLKLDNLAPDLWPLFLGGLAILQIVLAVDAYQEARRSR